MVNCPVSMVTAMSTLITSIMQHQQQDFARSTDPVQYESPHAGHVR
jgi:hypothetical protein